MQRSLSKAVPAAMVAAVAALALSCGRGDSPASPASPAPPSATPTPAPPVGGGPGPATCSLGPGSTEASCSRRSAVLLNDVDAAIDATVQQRPTAFDRTDEAAPGTRAYRVLDEKAYVDGVVANLRAKGYCAQPDYDDPLEFIHVKSSNELSEVFDLLLSSGHIRRGTGSYRETCTPASFPVDRGSDVPPSGSGCRQPYPPPISRFNAKVHLKSEEHYTLDSTPIVGPNVAYCTSIGFDDGRSLCPVRPEGDPERQPCEAWRVGKARDTGRVGPTWTRDGQLCTGAPTGCENHPENQYQLLVHRNNPGTYRVCAENGACGQVVVER